MEGLAFCLVPKHKLSIALLDFGSLHLAYSQEYALIRCGFAEYQCGLFLGFGGRKMAFLEAVREVSFGLGWEVLGLPFIGFIVVLKFKELYFISFDSEQKN